MGIEYRGSSTAAVNFIRFECDKCKAIGVYQVDDTRPDLIEGQVFVELVEPIGVEVWSQTPVLCLCERCAEVRVEWTELFLFRVEEGVESEKWTFLEAVAPILEMLDDPELEAGTCRCSFGAPPAMKEVDDEQRR